MEILWLLGNSVPAAAAVKSTTAKNEQDDKDDQKCVGIHGSLLGEIELARFNALRVSMLNSSSRSLHPISRQALS